MPGNGMEESPNHYVRKDAQDSIRERCIEDILSGDMHMIIITHSGAYDSSVFSSDSEVGV